MLGQKSFNKQFKQFGKSITKDAKAMEDVIHKLACLTMMPKMELSVSSADKRFGGFWEFLHFYQRTEVVEETKKLLTKPGQFFIYTKDTDKPFQRYDVAYFGQTQRLSFEIVKHKLESFNIFLDTKELLKEVTGPELMPFIINYCKGSFPNKPSILPNGIPRLGAKNVKILNELGFMQCGIPNYKMDIVEFEFKEPREGFPKRATSRKAINGTMEVTHSMLMDEALLLHKLNEKSQFFVKVLGVNYSKGTTVYFDYGISSLKCILLTHKGKIGDDYKLKWITQAAEGLKSLKEMGFLHRNINVSRYFIGEDKILKLGDCFMAKGGPHSKITDPHMNTQMKWVAPETINSLEYTYESEVWSYGVLAWCIYSEEVDPLAEVSKTQLKRMMSKRFQKTNGAHLKGFSLTMPKTVPTPIVSLIESCWSHCQCCRPQIETITEKLNNLIKITNI